MNPSESALRPGVLLHRLIAVLCGLACVAASLFVFRDLDPETVGEKWNAVHSFGVVGVAVGVYLISKILLPLRDPR